MSFEPRNCEHYHYYRMKWLLDELHDEVSRMVNREVLAMSDMLDRMGDKKSMPVTEAFILGMRRVEERLWKECEKVEEEMWKAGNMDEKEGNACWPGGEDG